MAAKGIGVEERSLCLLCGGQGVLLYQGLRDPLFNAPGTWGFRRCLNCGFVWLNPRPIASDIPKLYEQYFTHDPVDYASWLARVKSALREAVLASRFGYDSQTSSRLRRVLGRIVAMIGPINERVGLSVMTLKALPKGKLLDVGCGNGLFLAKMQALGWEVEGVEPDGEAVRIARERFGLSVHQGTLENAGFLDDTFNAITMSHALEHVPDPISTLRECRRVVKPGGKLVVVTPNIQSLGYRIFQKSWRGLEVPRHLYLFTAQTLKVTAQLARLQILELRTTARTAHWIWTDSRWIQRYGHLPYALKRKRGFWMQLEGLIFLAAEYGLCKVTDAGEELLLVATK